LIFKWLFLCCKYIRENKATAFRFNILDNSVILTYKTLNFTKQIIEWYRRNCRNLPWREGKDAYKVWLSEVILQQTRVEQGLPYYVKFVQNYPTVHHLAAANQEEVLKLWQGLGYYSRARNMLQTANMVVNDFDGRFPSTYKELIKLKGVGDYTAAAIASIVFNEPVPVVDGNVNRVVSRYFAVSEAVDSGVGKSKIKEAMLALIPNQEPGMFNQAVMELGSLVCKPSNPDCQHCPVADGCAARAQGNVLQFPVKGAKRAATHRFFVYVVPIVDGHTVLRLRKGDDIWKGLYEFPLIETSNQVNSADHLKALITKHFDVVSFELRDIHSAKHLLTHRVINAQFVLFTAASFTGSVDDMLVPINQVAEYPMAKLTERYLSEVIENSFGG
jgi:A/G-specific adenine glycosylase